MCALSTQGPSRGSLLLQSTSSSLTAPRIVSFCNAHEYVQWVNSPNRHFKVGPRARRFAMWRWDCRDELHGSLGCSTQPSRVLSNAITRRGRVMPIGNPAARKLRIRAHVSRPGPDCVRRIAVPSEQQPANARFSAAKTGAASGFSAEIGVRDVWWSAEGKGFVAHLRNAGPNARKCPPRLHG
jgi:hypothetical protein